MIHNPKSVHAFNHFEEDDHVEMHKYHFRIIDLIRRDLLDMGVTAIEE